MKSKIVAAQEDNVDRGKIQADVTALRDQIATVVDAASFNGLNLLKNVSGINSVSVLASLNRAADQSVSSSNISFARRSLEAGATVVGPTTTADADANIPLFTFGAAAAEASTAVVAGQSVAMELTRSDGSGVMLTYTVADSDVAAGRTTDQLVTAIAASFTSQLAAASSKFSVAGIAFSAGATANVLDLDITAADLTATFDRSTSRGGGLAGLSLIDVSTAEGADAALDAIEPLIQNAIDAAASFGSAQGRIQTQSEYVGKIMDGLTSGIGALVDADMEAASARLQALQVQQQLGIQALSIANQSPQNILALFR
jgi:flagellin